MNTKSLLPLALVILSVAPGLSFAENAPPKLKEDTKPLDRSRPEASYSGVVKRAMPSVVTVLSTRTVTFQRRSHPFLEDPLFQQFFDVDPRQSRPRPFQNRGLGSGIIVSEDGYIITNSHVVDGADKDSVRVMLPNDKTEHEATVVGTDPQTDIAVLKIEAKNLKPITLGDSDNLEVGDIVLAVGNPFGVGQSVSRGIISALGRSSGILGMGGYENFIQTDAPINVGNSGGALVDAEGRLIGVNQSIATPSGTSAGVGFAVPVNLARSVLERIVTDGKVRRGYLGVRLGPVTSEMAGEFQLADDSGALVSDVQSGTPAAKAGLKPYDVITAVNGKKIGDWQQLRVMIAQMRPKSKVTLTLVRDTKPRTLEVTLGELPERIVASADNDTPVIQTRSDLLKGVKLAELDSKTRKERKIPSSVEGVFVEEVAEDSRAANRLHTGDVIMEANRGVVSSVEELEAIAAKSGERLLLRVWSEGEDGGGTRVIVLGNRRR